MPVDSPIGTPSVVIFTAHFGQSDIVMPPAQTIPGVEFLVLTDEVVRVPKPWKIRMVTMPPNVTNPRLKNRWCKLHANRLLPDFGFSVYVDTQIQIIGDLRPLIFEFCNSGATLGVLRHPHSRSIDEEVARSLRTGRISREDHAANWSTQSERQ